MPPQTENASYLPQERPEEFTAAFEQFQQREQAHFAGLRDQTSGSKVAALASSYEQPTYARQPSYAAYEEHDPSPYRQSDRNNGTPNSREGMLRYGNDPTLAPAFESEGTRTSGTPGRSGGHFAPNIYRPTRQQSTWSQNSAYRGAHGDLANNQAYSTTGYQQSPHLLPVQEPHDVNTPPTAFQTRFPTLHGAHTLPPSRQGFHTSENAIGAQPQSTSAHTGNLNAARPPRTSFADSGSLSQSVIHGDINAVPDPAHTHNSEAGQSNTRLESGDETEEPKAEPRKKSTRKKKDLPGPKCATLKKTIHKQGETEVVNGQLMWLDPNEPEDKKRSKFQPSREHIDLTLYRAGGGYGRDQRGDPAPAK